MMRSCSSYVRRKKLRLGNRVVFITRVWNKFELYPGPLQGMADATWRALTQDSMFILQVRARRQSAYAQHVSGLLFVTTSSLNCRTHCSS